MLFRHFRDTFWEIAATGGSTLAVQELEPWFFASLKPGDFFEKRFGLAKCHPKDNFCKKTGRELAESKAKVKRFTVVKIVDTVDKREITFNVDGYGELVMYKSQKAQQVRLA